MPAERARALAAAAALAALLALGFARRPDPAPVPPRQPASACAPWMADALPGVGPKSRDAVAAAIRTGRIDELPPLARAMARAVFAP